MFIISTLLILSGIIKLLSLASCGQMFTNSVKKAKLKLLHIQRSFLLKTCSKKYQEVDLLHNNLNENSSFKPYNCFTLNFASQVTGFSVLLTFAIVLFQFRASDLNQEK